MELKLANISNATGFLSTLVLRDHSKWRANKHKDEEEHNAHLNFRSKSNEYFLKEKILIHHEIIDHMPEQTESAITKANKKSKFWVHPILELTIFSLTFSFKFSYICIVDIWTLKGSFVKENKRPFNFIKTTTKQNFITNLHCREALRKLNMQLVIPLV